MLFSRPARGEGALDVSSDDTEHAKNYFSRDMFQSDNESGTLLASGAGTRLRLTE